MAVAVAAALLATVAVALLPRSGPARVRHAAPRLPAPVEPAFVPGPPEPFRRDRFASHWAPVVRATAARSAPAPSAPVVAGVDAVTPEGTRNIVAVLGRRADHDGRVWVRARLPVLPNGTTGWLPRTALGPYGAVHTRLVVDLETLELTLFDRGRRVLEAPVGVGTPGSPTPRGTFYVRNRLTRYRSPAYGPLAFGTSARSPQATDWPAGGFVGIHGTDRPDLIPGRVSHGCIRMRNADVLRLGRLMPVGTPVLIR